MRIYAFGILAPYLCVWCTSYLFIRHWLIRGEAYQYIDHAVYFNTRDSHHHPNKHIILHVFRAPKYDSLVPLNWYEQLVFLVWNLHFLTVIGIFSLYSLLKTYLICSLCSSLLFKYIIMLLKYAITKLLRYSPNIWLIFL